MSEQTPDDRVEDQLQPPPLWRAIVLPLLALIVGAALLYPHSGEILEATELLSLGDAAALVLLHLLALVLRAEAWGLCVSAAGQPVRRRLLHGSSALRFLADTLVPTYAGAWVRIALIRRSAGKPPNSPTIGQMVTADGLLLLVEGVITIGLIAIAVVVSPVEWPLIIGFVALIVVLTGLVVYLRRRFSDRLWTKTFDVLRSAGGRGRLFGMLAVVLTVQPLRFYIAFNALGLDAAPTEALVAFLLTSVYGALPIGPGPSVVAATATLFAASAIALVASAGLVLVATSVVAAGLYSLVCAPTLGRRERGPAPTDEVAGSTVT